MNLLQDTADCVKKHQDKLREAYKLYSSVSDGLESYQSINHGRATKGYELWFLACTLTEIPSNVCAICPIANYRDGRGLRLKDRLYISLGEGKRMKNIAGTIYTAYRGGGVDISPYKETLEEEFDLRKTGIIGCVLIDLFEEEIISIMQKDDFETISRKCFNQLITSRNLIFEVNTRPNFSNGEWYKSRYIGPYEARNKGYYWNFRSDVLTYSSSVNFEHKNYLRHKEDRN